MRSRATTTIALGVALALGIAAGCATVQEPAETTSIQTLEYYPYQVKGYQNSYPARTVLVLMPLDQRDFHEAAAYGHDPVNGNPAIGVVLDRDHAVQQRIYSNPLPPMVQAAIIQSAAEAGLTATPSPETTYRPGQKIDADYVLASKISRGWVLKRQTAKDELGPAVRTESNFALDVVVFKPPFSIPFWQGRTAQSYDDPPLGSFGLGPEDETGIYDEPGQVLSVALTRAVAGIFEESQFRTLVMQDQIHR